MLLLVLSLVLVYTSVLCWYVFFVRYIRLLWLGVLVLELSVFLILLCYHVVVLLIVMVSFAPLLFTVFMLFVMLCMVACVALLVLFTYGGVFV